MSDEDTSSMIEIREQPQRHQGTKAPAIDFATERVGKQIVDCAFSVHKELGPGLLESIYEECFVHELSQRKIPYLRQKIVPVTYKGNLIDANFRLDLVVNDNIVIELKAVDSLAPVHTAQLLSYLRLTGGRLGYLINFNAPVIKQGIRRIVL